MSNTSRTDSPACSGIASSGPRATPTQEDPLQPKLHYTAEEDTVEDMGIGGRDLSADDACAVWVCRKLVTVSIAIT